MRARRWIKLKRYSRNIQDDEDEDDEERGFSGAAGWEDLYKTDDDEEIPEKAEVKAKEDKEIPEEAEVKAKEDKEIPEEAEVKGEEDEEERMLEHELGRKWSIQDAPLW